MIDLEAAIFISGKFPRDETFADQKKHLWGDRIRNRCAGKEMNTQFTKNVAEIDFKI